jgi:hypothetical protein
MAIRRFSAPALALAAGFVLAKVGCSPPSTDPDPGGKAGFGAASRGGGPGLGGWGAEPGGRSNGGATSESGAAGTLTTGGTP